MGGEDSYLGYEDLSEIDEGDNENNKGGYGSVDVDKNHPRFRTFTKGKGVSERDSRKNRTHIPKNCIKHS